MEWGQYLGAFETSQFNRSKGKFYTIVGAVLIEAKPAHDNHDQRSERGDIMHELVTLSLDLHILRLNVLFVVIASWVLP